MPGRPQVWRQGLPEYRHTKQDLILRLWPDAALVWFPVMHQFCLADALALEVLFWGQFVPPVLHSSASGSTWLKSCQGAKIWAKFKSERAFWHPSHKDWQIFGHICLIQCPWLTYNASPSPFSKAELPYASLLTPLHTRFV
eukprot:965051-Pelagomonas_calceolata.AAC.1